MKLYFPVIVDERLRKPREIPSIPGRFLWPLGAVAKVARQAEHAGIDGIVIFGRPRTRDENASQAFAPGGIAQRAVEAARKSCGITVAADVCVCQYAPNGHCGVVSGGRVDRGATLSVLENISVTLAGAGAHILMPSGMTAGAVTAIRSRLDGSGFPGAQLFSVSGKFASSLFDPFRVAADCRPAFGDKRAYQLDVTSAEKALDRLSADVAEGADAVVVKPALAYLDIVTLAKKKLKVPVGVFNVSGEYAMLKAAAMRKWIDEASVLREMLECFGRAGADFLISYHAPEMAKLAHIK